MNIIAPTTCTVPACTLRGEHHGDPHTAFRADGHGWDVGVIRWDADDAWELNVGSRPDLSAGDAERYGRALLEAATALREVQA